MMACAGAACTARRLTPVPAWQRDTRGHSRRLRRAAAPKTSTGPSPSQLHPPTAAAFASQWSSGTKPRLDSLWFAVAKTRNPDRLLLLLDDLLMQLRSSRSLAVHLQQQHTDAAWAAAARQVAAECSRYERYIHSNRAVVRRLQSLQASLLFQQQQQQQQDDSSPGRSPAEPTAQGGAAASILSLRRQLDLCSMLLLSLQPGSVEDSMQWLAALELPDANLTQMQQLQAQEQSLVAAIDSVLSQPVALELPATPEQLLQLPGREQAPTSSGSIAEDSSSHTTGTATAAQAPSVEQQQEQQQQPVLVNVTKVLLARLLQQCSDAAVRQQLYADVLQPKLQQASRLLSQLAGCRQYQARLLAGGGVSFHQLTQQRLQPPAGSQQADEAHQIQSLMQLQEALQPLCQQEVAWVARHASTQQQQQHPQDDAQLQLQQQQQQQQQEQVSAHSSSSAAEAPSGPWDWDFLLYQAALPFTAALQQDVGLLRQHLQLSGVVAGFSQLLQRLLGLQLLPRAVPPDGRSEVWAPHVLVLDVVRCQSLEHQQDQQQQHQHRQQQQQLQEHEQQHMGATGPELGSQEPGQLLGTVYLDIGGGYGARMLRYARSTPSSSSAHALPAVAVGISGSRLAARDGDLQDHKQQQQRAPPLVLSVAQLWELAHELGHAVHLVASSRQPACHLSGRFLPPHLLELPPQIMERLMLQPGVLAGVCLHHTSNQPLPAHLAAALATYYGSRYNSALAVSSRVAASLAEVMHGEYGGDMEDYWRGAWEAASGLPAGVAAAGSLREVSLLPVMAAHPGTYHCYIRAWTAALGICARWQADPANPAALGDMQAAFTATVGRGWHKGSLWDGGQLQPEQMAAALWSVPA